MSDLLEVQRIQRKQIFWRVKKTETVELMPNSYAVIHMETLDNHRNVIALVHLSPHVTGHFFTSKHMQVVKNLGAVLSKCCSGKFIKLIVVIFAILVLWVIMNMILSYYFLPNDYCLCHSYFI